MYTNVLVSFPDIARNETNKLRPEKMEADVKQRMDLNEEIPDEAILKFSRTCTMKPRLLARNLNLDETMLEQIEFAEPGNRYEQMYQILYTWKQIDPCPTWKKLNDATDTGLLGIMEEYCRTTPPHGNHHTTPGDSNETPDNGHVATDETSGGVKVTLKVEEGSVECDGPKPSKIRRTEPDDSDDQSDDSEVPILSDNSGTFDQDQSCDQSHDLSYVSVTPSAPPFHLITAQPESQDHQNESLSHPNVIQQTSTGLPLLVGPPIAPPPPAQPAPADQPLQSTPSTGTSSTDMMVDDTILTCKLPPPPFPMP